MRWIAALLSLIAFAPFAPAATTQPASRVVVIPITGEITDATRDDLQQRLADARQMHADTVILNLDTYGGMAAAGLDISSMLKSAADLHTIAYVQHKAISAGAMIALACNEIVMGPAARLGDAAPISISTDGSLLPLPPTERAKMQSPIIDDFRDSAVRNGYDPLLIQSMVALGPGVWWVQNAAGDRKFVSAAPAENGDWTPIAGVPQPVVTSTELFTVSTAEAVKLGLSKGTAADVDQLITDRHFTLLATLAPSAGDQILTWLASLHIRLILLVMFLLSIYIAVHVPGHGAAEACATVTLGLLLFAPWMTGYGQTWEIFAIVGGIGLVLFELFVIPGHGIAAIPGAALAIFGLVMTFVPKEPSGLPGTLPSLNGTWVDVQHGLEIVVAGLVISMLLGAWLRRYLPAVPFFNRLVLSPSAGRAIATGVAVDRWPLPGDRGSAATDLLPGGSAVFTDQAAGVDRTISVVSDRGFVPRGQPIVVHDTANGKIVVREESLVPSPGNPGEG